MNSFFNSFPVNISHLYFSDKIRSLSQPQKKILLIATTIITSLAMCYYIFTRYCFKAKVLDQQDDSQINHLLYFPKHLNQQPPIRSDGFIVTKLENLKAAPLYEVECEELNDNLTTTGFHIENYTVNDGVVEFLIECLTSSNPEVQALWDETNHKLYLVGGHKHDPRPKSNDPNVIHCIPSSYAWIRLDLNELPYKGEIPIYVRLPALHAGHKFTKLRDEEDALLITINNEEKSN